MLPRNNTPRRASRCRHAPVVLTCALLCAAAGAQTITTGEDITPPQSVIAKTNPQGPIRGRMLQVFDFEERETNPGSVPRYWYRSQDSADRPRPGFPSWNQAKLVYVGYGDEAESNDVLAFRGIGSVLLPTKGGSASLLLDAGTIPVFPDTDYAISCVVQTQRMNLARAALIARILGADGKPIPNTERVSQLVTSENAWRELTVRIATGTANAAFIQLELVVLQPRQIDSMFPTPQRPIDAFKINSEDRDARAWFDDLSVLQLPRVGLTCNATGNIATSVNPPEFSILVRDLANEELTLSLDAIDATGASVVSKKQQLYSGGVSTRWTPALPAAGWYRVRMKLSTATGDPVGGTFTDLVWLPQPETKKDDDVVAEERIDASGVSSTTKKNAPTSQGDLRRFAISIDEAPMRHIVNMPSLLASTGMKVVTMPLWTRSLTERDINAHTKSMQSVIRQLVSDYVDVTLSIPRLPDTLGERSNVATTDAAAIFSRPSDEWLPFSQEPFEKLGALTGRWQVGLPLSTGMPGSSAFFRAATLSDLTKTRDAINKFVPGLTLAIPTSISQDWKRDVLQSASGATRLVVQIPRDLSPEGIRNLGPQRVQTLATSPRNADPTAAFSSDAGLQWVLTPDATDDFASPIRRAGRMTRQAVELWRLLGDSAAPGMSPPMSIAIANPWRLSESEREAPRPIPELAAMLHLRSVLADARIVGQFPAREGITCHILAPKTSEGEAMPAGWLIAWNESCDPAKAFIDMPVGPNAVELRDVFGNSTLLPTSIGPDGISRTIHVQVSDQPIFIRGIDVALAKFFAGVSITPQLLDAAAELGEHTITITNPWPQSISGKLSILEPGGFDSAERDRSWRINPRTVSFALPAGATREFPFTVAFRPSEESGPKRFLLGVDLTNDLPYGVLRVERELELGLNDFHVDGAFSIRGEDLIAECIVTNTSDKPITLEITALAPGAPRSRATIPDIAPGSQAIRRFTYKQSADTLKGQHIVFSVNDPEKGDRLTRSVAIE